MPSPIPESIVNQPDAWSAWLRDRVPLPSADFRQLRDNEYRWAMVIAGVTDLQLLADVNEAIARQLSLPDGADYRAFQRDLNALLGNAGWTGVNATRRQLIWHMAVRSAYADGRWYQFTDPDVLAGTGAWKWVHRWPRNPRLDHLALDGRLYPPGTTNFDGKAYPPSEYFCHCIVTIVPQSEASLRASKRPPRYRPGRSPADRAPVLRKLLSNLPAIAQARFRAYIAEARETIETAIEELE